jgi:hypothetical protein
MIGFTLRVLYFQGKSQWYLLDRRLCGLKRLDGE